MLGRKDNRRSAHRGAAAGGAGAFARPGSARPAEEIDLTTLVFVVLRQWRFVAISTAVCVALALAYVAVAPKTYRATTRVLLDPRDKEVVGEALQQPLQGVDIAWVETKANLVASAATLQAVVKSENLTADPEFGGTPDESLRHLAEALLVERADLTYVLDISITTRSAAKSARLAQAVGDAFVASLRDVKADAARQASDLLSRQIDDLREKARAADMKLQEFKRKNNIVAASGKLVDEETLSQLNQSFIAASLRTQEALARKNRIDAARRAGGAQFGSALDSINSAVISRLKIEYALAAKRAADLAEQLGPSHPRMISARAELEKTRALINDELNSLAATATVDYDVALAAETSTRKALDAATATVNDSGDAGITLRELDNEAAVRRDLYKAFVSRLEQTGIQQTTQISDARVIVPAQVPLYAFGPKRSLILALAMIIGVGTGVTGALYRGRFDLMPARGAGQPASPRPQPTPPRGPTRRPSAGDRLPILAEISVDTTIASAGRFGRVQARGARDIVASAVEIKAGKAHRPGVTAIVELAARLEAACGGAPILVQGVAAGAPTAAVAYGLARALSGSGEVLLVDAAHDPFRLAEALCDEIPLGLLDTDTDTGGDVDGREIAVRLAGEAITVLAAASAERAVEMDEQADYVADLIEAETHDFDAAVISLGGTLAPSLYAALSDLAGVVVLVVQAAVWTEAETRAAVVDLAAATPRFAGLILTTERAATAEPRRSAA